MAFSIPHFDFDAFVTATLAQDLGADLETINAIAVPAFDYVSRRRLTQSATAGDIGRDFTPL
jgi:hypothetical protein